MHTHECLRCGRQWPEQYVPTAVTTDHARAYCPGCGSNALVSGHAGRSERYPVGHQTEHVQNAEIW